MSLGAFGWKIVDATFPGLSTAFKIGAGLGSGVAGATPSEAVDVAGASDDPITAGVIGGSAQAGGGARRQFEQASGDNDDAQPRRLSVMGFFGLSNDLTPKERAWGLFRLAIAAGIVGTPTYFAWRAATAAGRAAVALAPAALDTGGKVGTAVLSNASGAAQLVAAVKK